MQTTFTRIREKIEVHGREGEMYRLSTEGSLAHAKEVTRGFGCFSFALGVPARTLIAMLTLLIALAMGLMTAGSAHAAGTVTVVETLGAATPSTQFILPGSGGHSILPTQFPGPRFELAEQTVLTEIGGFVTTFALPATVEIVPAAPDGSPDGAHVLASYVLSSDGDPFTWSYESVAASLSLPPGTYFALFGVQDDDFGIVLSGASSPFEYRAGLTPAGFLNPTTGQSSASPGEFMAVRILGQLPIPSVPELLARLAAAAAEIGPGTSLADKVARAQNYLAANDIPNTCSTLTAFAYEVKAQSSKTIDSAQATTLVRDAEQIQTLLGC